MFNHDLYETKQYESRNCPPNLKYKNLDNHPSYGNCDLQESSILHGQLLNRVLKNHSKQRLHVHVCVCAHVRWENTAGGD